MFSEAYPSLFEQVPISDHGFSLKLLAVVNRLAPKSKHSDGSKIDKDLLIEKTCHQLIEHIDDRRVTSCDDLIQAAHFLEANASDIQIQERHRLANCIIDELERRGYLFEPAQIEQVSGIV